ncbi:hypothetical protein [Mesoplasma corruscae]|uniref:DNA uptake protein n=1 Tax=Mesoplasma corruscae TaxID=216874 RepID=A0A2S5RHM9_9MOLU|nr:hypothetical protein [Mesoplasma corruscae]PPE06655.1 DNA uptake protein [Mesoplasma corruscae]
MKRVKAIILSLILILCLVIGSILFYIFLPSKTKELTNINYYVMSVGNANFTIVEKDFHAVLIDAGSGVDSTSENELKFAEIENSHSNRKSEQFFINNYQVSPKKKWTKAKTTSSKWAIDFMRNKAGIQYLDGIFISHKHSDHYDLVFEILKSYEQDKTKVVAPLEYDNLTTTIIKNAPNWNGKVDTKFSKKYNFLGGTFENLSSYSSNKTLKPLKERPWEDPNDTSQVIRFTADGNTVLVLGDLQNQGILRDDKFMKKVEEKQTALLIAAHHSSDNSATLKVAELIGHSKYTIFSTTMATSKWDKFSGGHKSMNPKPITEKLIKQFGNDAEFFVTGDLDSEFSKIPEKQTNSSFKWSSKTNKIEILNNTILDSIK